MNGIDISSWQRGIDIAATDAEFVIVKATEGYAWQDPYCRKFAEDTLAAGKLLGFYHFARQNGARAEADTFIDAVRPYLGRCILALDFEADAVGNGVGWAKEWLDYVREKTGASPIIYMSKSVCRQYDWSSVAGEYELWAAQYPSYDPSGWIDDPWTDGYGFGAWGYGMPFIYQYRSVGGIPGYSGNIDKNKCYGTRERWIELQSKEDDMTFNDVWFGGTVNDSLLNGAYITSPANLIWGDYLNTENTLGEVRELRKEVANLKVSGAQVDYEKLATMVCDKIAARMKE